MMYEQKKLDPATIGMIVSVILPLIIQVGKVVLPLLIDWIKSKKDENGVVSFQSPL